MIMPRIHLDPERKKFIAICWAAIELLTEKERDDLAPRLKRIEGQVKGIEKMVEEGRYFIDVLQQILAARAALQKAALIILESHAKSCVVSAIQENRAEQSIEELMSVLRQFIK